MSEQRCGNCSEWVVPLMRIDVRDLRGELPADRPDWCHKPKEGEK